MTPAGLGAASAWGELASGAATAVAAVLSLRAARRSSDRSSDRPRWGWGLLGAAMALWTVSTVVTDVPVLLRFALPVGYAQGLQGVALAMILAGLLVLPTAPWSKGAFPRLMLDVLTTVLCLVLIGVETVAREVAERGGTEADHVFGLLYPASALVLGARAYVLGRGHGGRRRPDLALLFAASAPWLVAGVGSALLGTGSRVGPIPVSVAFGLGALSVAAAAHVAPRAGQASPVVASRLNQVLSLVPEAVAVAAAVVTAVAGLEHWYDWTVAAAALLVIVARHAVTSLDARRSRAFLEAEVGQRTSDLQQMSDHQSRILAAVGEGIIGIDPDGVITFVNVAAGQMLDHDPEDLVGRQACEVLCAVPHEHCPLTMLSTLGQVITDEQTSYRRRDGSQLPVEVTAAPNELADGDGRFGLVLAFRDVTARQAVEQMKQQFVSSVSHELRTPLTSIRGVLEMLSDGDAGDLPPLAHELIATAERGSERLSRLVNDIIDVEKLAAGDFSVVPRPTDVAPLIGDAIASLEGLAASTGVRIRIGELGGRALCDPDRVEQALVNLIGNAVKFSPEDGEVLVSAAAGPDHVVVSVRDHGRGIPADEISSVFDRFHQVTATDATEKGGTGLGLTITRSIVERHGGRIWVESTLGEGTVFHFTLPLVMTEVAPEVAPDPSPKGPPRNPPRTLSRPSTPAVVPSGSRPGPW